MEYFAYSQKAFVYKYIVMLSDIDQFQHMSFANYLRLMFLSTDALFVSLLDDVFLSRHRFQLIDSRMQFKRQTKIGDSILIKVNSSMVSDGRFTLLYTFVIEGEGGLVSLGKQNYEIRNVADAGEIDETILGNLEKLLKPISVDENYLVYKY